MRKYILLILLLFSLPAFSQVVTWYNISKKEIPQKDSSLFHLDGSIITIGADKYFRDISGNGRHFLITNYDFPTGWKIGFPYKSAATISAPAGDATLIAEDINYYLYNSGGTPNQIPVGSLFQDIDFEHKIFCKHQTQILNENTVEFYEPRVLSIVMYNHSQAGSDLTACQSYFSVPTEDGTALWVTKSGNDATGDGSKALPYLTIGKFITVGTGKTCYVKTGDYNEVLSFNNKTETIIGIGFNNLTSTTSGTIGHVTAASTTNIKNFNCTATLTSKIQFNVAGCNVTFDNIRLIGGTNDIRMVTTNNTLTFNNSYLTALQEIYGNITYNYCYFGQAASLNTFKTNGKTLILNHCRLKENTSTGLINNLGASSTITFNDCEYYGNTYVDAVNAYAPTINLINNKIKVNTKTALTYSSNTGSKNVTMTGNTITTIGTNATLVSIGGLGKTVFNNNTINGNLTDNTITIVGTSQTDTCSFNNNSFAGLGITLYLRNYISNVENNIMNSTQKGRIYGTVTVADNFVYTIKNNTIISRVSDNAFIQLGTEAPADISFGRLNGSIILQNKFLGPQYFGNDPLSQHGILIYCQQVEMKYNYFNGTVLGNVFKSTGVSYPSVVHHEVFVNTSSALIAKGAPNIYWYNNTIVWTSTTNSTIGLTLMEDSEYPGSYSTGCKFKNNIICDFRSDVNTAFLKVTTNDLSGADIDYNIYYKKNSSTDFAMVDGSYVTFAQWKALGYDTHSILLNDTQANNLFTDYVNGDYSLKTGSVAIGSGVNVGATYDDGLDALTNWGEDAELPIIITKQQGASWDIGAYVH